MEKQVLVYSEDLIKALRNMPIAIVQLMVNEALRAGSKDPIKAFQSSLNTSACGGGFNWDKSTQGGSFWVELLINHNYQPFYDNYPKMCYPRKMKVYYRSRKDPLFNEKTDCQERTVVLMDRGVYYTEHSGNGNRIDSLQKWFYASEIDGDFKKEKRPFTGKYVLTKWGEVTDY